MVATATKAVNIAVAAIWKTAGVLNIFGLEVLLIRHHSVMIL